MQCKWIESLWRGWHPHIDTLKSNLALVLQGQGKWQEAEEMHRQVVGGMRQVFGDGHPDTLRSNLVVALRARGQWEEAEGMNREVLEIRRRVLGEEHPDTLDCRNELANALQQGNLQESEEMHREVLELRARLFLESTTGSERPCRAFGCETEAKTREECVLKIGEGWCNAFLPVLRNVFAAGSGLAFLGPRHLRHPWTQRATGDLVFLLGSRQHCGPCCITGLGLLRNLLEKQQEIYVGHIWKAARSSEPSSDQSASRSLSNRHSDAPVVSSWGSASGSEACESSDDGTVLTAPLGWKLLGKISGGKSRNEIYRGSFLAPAASLAHASFKERCDEKLWML